jgi:hypothetical protein
MDPKEGEAWSIVRNGVHMDGVGPFRFDEEPHEEPQPGTPNKARREARFEPR